MSILIAEKSKLFKILCAVSAKRTNKVRGQRFSFVNVAAYSAYVAFLFLSLGGAGILYTHIDGANGAFEQTDAGVVARGLDHHGFFLDADDLADDAADGRDLISYLEVVTHIVGFLLAFFLRADHQKIQCNEHHSDDDQHLPTATGRFTL